MSIRYFLLMFFSISVLSSCKKGFLDKAPSKSLIIPATLKDFQALLDNPEVTLYASQLGDLGSDDYYLTTARWQAVTPVAARNAYVWAPEIFEGAKNFDWTDAYKFPILFSNVVLERISEVPVTAANQQEWNAVKGTALFYRAFTFWDLAQVFCKPYVQATASTDLGIPVRLTADVNEKSVRATVLQTYEQILKDLHEAKDLLPTPVQTARNRPSKVAAFGMLARVCLSMQDYQKAQAYADSSLNIHNVLLDYNLRDPNLTRPFPAPANDEVLIQWAQENYAVISATTTIVDTTLFNSYTSNDLRKTLYFRLNATTGTYNYRGQYTGSINSSSAVTTSELYLIRAESRARNGDKTGAMNDLNTLLRTRWKKVSGVSTYVDMTAADATEALNKILVERRKELIFRGLRWSDLRRLNMNPATAKTLIRFVNNQTYTLLPNDPRYVYPIPDDEIRESGIQQNPR